MRWQLAANSDSYNTREGDKSARRRRRLCQHLTQTIVKADYDPRIQEM